MTLNELGIKHGTDKNSTCHDYLKYYERYFKELKDENFLFMEIGIFRGASCRMWREYFTKATIVGIDIKRKSGDIDGVNLEIGNCNDRKFTEGLFTKYGLPLVLIDDGSHLWSDMNASLEYFLPKVKSGGLFCLEDMQISYEPGRKKYGDSKVIPIERMKEYVDAVNLKGSDLAGGCRGQEFNKKKSLNKLEPMEEIIEWIHFYNGLTIIGRR